MGNAELEEKLEQLNPGLCNTGQCRAEAWLGGHSTLGLDAVLHCKPQNVSQKPLANVKLLVQKTKPCKISSVCKGTNPCSLYEINAFTRMMLQVCSPNELKLVVWVNFLLLRHSSVDSFVLMGK